MMYRSDEITSTDTFQTINQSIRTPQRRRSLIHHVELTKQFKDAAPVPIKHSHKLPLETIQYFTLIVEFFIVFVIMGNLVSHSDFMANYNLQSLYCGMLASIAYVFSRMSAGGYKRKYLVAKKGLTIGDCSALILSCGLAIILAFSFDKMVNPILAGFSIFGCFFLLYILHNVKGTFFKLLAHKGYALERVAIYGGESEAIAIGQQLVEQNINQGQILVSVYDERDNLAVLEDGRLGRALSIDDLIKDIVENQIDHVIICLPGDAKKRVEQLQEEFSRVAVKVSFKPIDFDGRFLPIILDDVPIYGWELIIKSIFDKIATVLGLIVISPILALIAIAIKLDSKGPILFKQERTGFNNQVFFIYKFRSMYGLGEDGHKAVQAEKNDIRVTRVGKILRKWSLDELPQVINVLKGEMSLVGPRPHPKGVMAGNLKFEKAVRNYSRRHRIKPGITGWAQVNGYRGRTDTQCKLASRVEHDIYYMENFSLLFDLVILFKTISVVIKGENAY